MNEIDEACLSIDELGELLRVWLPVIFLAQWQSAHFEAERLCNTRDIFVARVLNHNVLARLDQSPDEQEQRLTCPRRHLYILCLEGGIEVGNGLTQAFAAGILCVIKAQIEVASCRGDVLQFKQFPCCHGKRSTSREIAYTRHKFELSKPALQMKR